MKINNKKLRNYLKRKGLNIKQFLALFNFNCMTKFDLFCGKAQLTFDDAKEFLDIVGAEDAIEMIDWEAMNVKRPKRRDIFIYAN